MRRLTVVLALALAGCGYHPAGVSDSVPEGAHSIDIKLFANHSHDIGLEVALRRAITDEFRRHAALRIAEEGEGDVVLSGIIRNVSSFPVASSAIDEALQFQVVVSLAVRMTERTTGKVLFDSRVIIEQQDFEAVNGVVISSSPRFQRGTMNARDLLDLTNSQLGDTRQRVATTDLLDALARDVYQQSMGAF
jgi:hypothetical protein